MAIAFTNATTVSQQTGASPFTVAHTCSGSDRLLLVSVLSDTGSNITGVTYNGVALTKLVEVTQANDAKNLELWSLLNPASGTNNVVISYTLGVFVSAQILSYTGVLQSGFPDASASDGNTSQAMTRTGTVTTTVPDCWLVMTAQATAAAPTAGSGTTLRGTTTGTGRLGVFDSNGSLATGSQSLNADVSPTSHWAHIVVSIAPALGISPSSSLSPSASFSPTPSASLSPSSSVSPTPSASISPSMSSSSSRSPSASLSPSASPSPGDFPGPELFVSIAGIQRATDRVDTRPRILQDTLIITEYRGGKQANVCSFIAKGFTPSDGDRVVITLGGADNPERLFLGTVIVDTRGYVGTPSNGQVTVNCIDNTRLLDQRLVTKVYPTGTTVRAVFLDIVANYTFGFTTNNVAADLGTLTSECSFTEQYPSQCFEQLMKRTECEGNWYLDYEGAFGDLHAFQTETLAAAFTPSALVTGNQDFWDVTISNDGTQRVTRIKGEGGGSVALSEVSVSETVLPLDDPSWYQSSGGTIKSAHNIVVYTGVDIGGGGSSVGPGAKPSSAPALARAALTGVDTGDHDVAVAFVTGTGTSLVGPRATINVGFVPAPTTAATAGNPTNGGNMDVGSHRYYPVFRTAAGSTTAGPVSNSVTVTQETPPSAIGSISNTGGGGVSGLSPNSLYSWKYTFYRASDGAETTPSPAANIVTNSFGSSVLIDLSGCSTPPSGYTRRWYRTAAGGAGDYKYCDPNALFGGQETGGNFNDGAADASLGSVAPTTNNSKKGTCSVTSIPVSTDALVTHVDMYREFNSAGAATAKLAFSVTNGTTSANDTVANSSLGATVPSSNTAIAGRISVSDIPIGGATVTQRKVYMTVANNGGGTLKLALTIANNVDTTAEITIADSGLGADAETVDGSGLLQESGIVLPGETTIPIAGTAPFRSAGGWAIAGSQVIRYASFSGSSLAGIPASGVGAILAPINYNTTIFAAPQLTGCSGILYTIPKGESVNVYVVVNDTDAQTALAARLGANYGIKEEPFQNRSLGLAELTARCQAKLAQNSAPQKTLRWKSRDKNTRAGRLQSATLTDLNVNDDFLIQQVTITNFQPAAFPTFSAVGSDQLHTFEDYLRSVRQRAA